MYDLKHAYNMIRTTENEKHLRRVLYRFNSEQDWQEFAFHRVAFGNLIAALTLEVAKTLIAEKGTTIDALAAKQLADST